MKKLQKILVMTVLVALMVGIGAIASSAAATMEPVKVLASFDGSQSASIDTRGSMATISKGTNKYYEFDFTTSGANANFSTVSGNYAFLGKGDYIVMEFDFMAEDWKTVKSILVGWNSRNASGGALNDMHFSFGNDNGKPKISGNPLSGSITLSDSKPGQWHHFTMVVQIGGEHTVKSGSNLTAVKGQDAVEAYAYIDGVKFAQNLIGDGKEFWSTDTTFWQTLRLTSSSYNDQKMCIDNVRVVQYEATRELRDFFNYRNKNNGAFPDLNAENYPFVAYDADYDYPLGVPTCKVVELNGTETMFDRFDKATKRAASISGAKLVLLSDIADVEIKYPIKIERDGYQLSYSVAPGLRAEENSVLNPITGALSTELSFVKKTKYAYFSWAIDHTGEVFDSRGYTPLAIGEPVAYSGKEFKTAYYIDGILYTFGGQWLLQNGEALETVPAYAANSYYTLTPVIHTQEVYAILEAMDGTVAYACSNEEFASLVASAAKDSVITLVKDITLDAPLAIKSRITLDLAGKKLVANGTAAIQLADVAAGAVITSSVEGAEILATGVAFDTACAFTFEGENVLVSASSLIKTEAVVRGLAIDGGVFLISGDCVLLVGAEASLEAEIDATIVATNASLVSAQSSYKLTVDGVLSGVSLPASETSTIVLSEGLLLSGVSSFEGAALPGGVSLADEALVIAAKKVIGENGAVTERVVVNAAEVVVLVWEEGAVEYVIPGEQVAYLYSDYYDAKKFYTPNGLYNFSVDGEVSVGNVLDATWVGLTVTVEPLYDSTAFYIVAAKPDGTFDAYTQATNLAVLLNSGEYAEGTIFALGRKNMLLENVVVNTSYTVDLNGYGLMIDGVNKIVGAELTFMSTVAGASLYAEVQAFALEAGAAFIIDEENIASLGGTLAKTGE